MLRLPFEDGDSGAAAVANLKGHILAGGRPPITFKVPIINFLTPIDFDS